MDRRLVEGVRILGWNSALLEINDLRVLTCADVGRVIIGYLGSRMLLERRVHDYLNPMQRSRCGICLLSLREYETARLYIHMCPKMTSAALSGQKRK